MSLINNYAFLLCVTICISSNAMQKRKAREVLQDEEAQKKERLVSLRNLSQKEKDERLLIAAQKGDDTLLAALLRAGASVDACTRQKETALHLCARYGHTTCVPLLLHYNTSLYAQDSDGKTPFLTALVANQLSTLLAIYKEPVLIDTNLMIQLEDAHLPIDEYLLISPVFSEWLSQRCDESFCLEGVSLETWQLFAPLLERLCALTILYKYALDTEEYGAQLLTQELYDLIVVYTSQQLEKLLVVATTLAIKPLLELIPDAHDFALCNERYLATEAI